MHQRFTQTVAKAIADNYFWHVVNCMMCYANEGYRFDDPPEKLKKEFTNALSEKGCRINESRLKKIEDHYNANKKKFEKIIRKLYYEAIRF